LKEELLDILRKNKSKLGISLNDTRLVERLRKTYEASLEKVLPIKGTVIQDGCAD
jgi:hypothetical protein